MRIHSTETQLTLVSNIESLARSPGFRLALLVQFAITPTSHGPPPSAALQTTWTEPNWLSSSRSGFLARDDLQNFSVQYRALTYVGVNTGPQQWPESSHGIGSRCKSRYRDLEDEWQGVTEREARGVSCGTANAERDMEAIFTIGPDDTSYDVTRLTLYNHGHSLSHIHRLLPLPAAAEIFHSLQTTPLPKHRQNQVVLRIQPVDPVY